MDWESVPGKFTEEDAEIYKHWAKIVPDGEAIVELGTFHGRSAACLLEHLALNKKYNVTVYCVDFFGPESPVCDVRETLHPFVEMMDRHRSWMDTQPTVVFLPQDTRHAHNEFGDDSIWGCFVDSTHTYKATVQHIIRWWPKIKVGGRMGFHDYVSSFTGVIKAVHEHFPKRTPKAFSKYCIDYEKKSDGPIYVFE